MGTMPEVTQAVELGSSMRKKNLTVLMRLGGPGSGPNPHLKF